MQLLWKKKLLGFVAIVIVFLVVSLNIYSLPVQAGIFSFLEELFGKNENQTENKNNNLQTMPLLEAIYNSNIDLAKGNVDITIVDENALLPDSGPIGTIADVENTPPNDRISIYIVREGDSLSQIAEMFDVSVNTIIWANDINHGDLIRTWQELIILPVTGVQYTVKNGDTVGSIAKKLKGDVDEIIRFNDLDPEGMLNAGQIITVPDGEYASPTITRYYSQKKIGGAKGTLYSNYYLRPINGGVKTQGLHGYNAIDIAASCGTPIFASASGDVIISKTYGWNAGAGKYVVIDHPNGTQTLYAHLSKNIIFKGWHVVKGQVIGYIGTTGRSTGCHLHFAIRGQNAPGNPF